MFLELFRGRPGMSSNFNAAFLPAGAGTCHYSSREWIDFNLKTVLFNLDRSLPSASAYILWVLCPSKGFSFYHLSLSLNLACLVSESLYILSCIWIFIDTSPFFQSYFTGVSSFSTKLYFIIDCYFYLESIVIVNYVNRVLSMPYAPLELDKSNRTNSSRTFVKAKASFTKLPSLKMWSDYGSWILNESGGARTGRHWVFGSLVKVPSRVSVMATRQCVIYR